MANKPQPRAVKTNQTFMSGDTEKTEIRLTILLSTEKMLNELAGNRNRRGRLIDCLVAGAYAQNAALKESGLQLGSTDPDNEPE